MGGGNAGHTIVIGEETFVLHLIPCGILRAGTQCVIGNGVVIALEELFEEIDLLQQRSINVDQQNLLVSSRAHLIFPYHRLAEQWQEMVGSDKIGTTLRGIGPCYTDKKTRRTREKENKKRKKKKKKKKKKNRKKKGKKKKKKKKK